VIIFFAIKKAKGSVVPFALVSYSYLATAAKRLRVSVRLVPDILPEM